MNTAEIPTPRTDAQKRLCDHMDTQSEAFGALLEHARLVECELSIATAESKKWEQAYDEIQEPLLFEINRDGIGETETYVDCIKRILEDRDKATAKLEKARLAKANHG